MFLDARYSVIVLKVPLNPDQPTYYVELFSYFAWQRYGVYCVMMCFCCTEALALVTLSAQHANEEMKKIVSTRLSCFI